jgi:hypothetical protein
MDQAAIGAMLSRLDLLEQENKLLKQWIARLKQNDEELGQRLQSVEARCLDVTSMPNRTDRDQARRLALLERRQRLLIWGTVISGIVIGLMAYGSKKRLDGMSNIIQTRELEIVNEDGNIGIAVSNKKDHGPRLFMYDTLDYLERTITGTIRVMLAVGDDGRPSLYMNGKSPYPRDPSLPFKSGPMAISLGLANDDFPQLILSGPNGQDYIWAGWNPKNQRPTLETNWRGTTDFRAP